MYESVDIGTQTRIHIGEDNRLLYFYNKVSDQEAIDKFLMETVFEKERAAGKNEDRGKDGEEAALTERDDTAIGVLKK